MLGLTGSSDLKMANESTVGDVADVSGLVGTSVVTDEGEEGSVAIEMKMLRS